MRAPILPGLVLPGMTLAAPARAVDFTVEHSFDDETDANPGDGICASVSGVCTLRTAVQEANALAGPDRIFVPFGTYFLEIPGADEDQAATGDLDLTDDVTIIGESTNVTTIDGRGTTACSRWGRA
jgi:CSLREA domain-containing protein